MRLWLDDVRDPRRYSMIHEWTWVKTAAEAIELLKTGQVEYASLDHDLGGHTFVASDGPEPTGYTVVLWLEAHPEFWPKEGVAVHSMNPAGAMRMRAVIDAHYRRQS